MHAHRHVRASAAHLAVTLRCAKIAVDLYTRSCDETGLRYPSDVGRVVLWLECQA